MKRLALLLVALATLSSAGQSTGARAIIERQIASYCKAMQAKDIKGVSAVMTNDFTSEANGGKVNHDQALAALKQMFQQAKSIKISCTITSLKMEKANAHLTSHNILDIDVPGPKGKVMKFHSDSTSDEIWVPTNGTYKIKSSKQLSSKQTLDGKPVGGV